MSEEIDSFSRADGDRTLKLYKRSNGFFSYSEYKRVVDFEPDLSPEPFEYDVPVYESGLFDTPERAIEDASQKYDWLCPN